MNLGGFSQNANQKDFCPGSFLEGRAKVLQIFGWHFGRNDDIKIHSEFNWPLGRGNKCVYLPPQSLLDRLLLSFPNFLRYQGSCAMYVFCRLPFVIFIVGGRRQQTSNVLIEIIVNSNLRKEENYIFIQKESIYDNVLWVVGLFMKFYFLLKTRAFVSHERSRELQNFNGLCCTPI